MALVVVGAGAVEHERGSRPRVHHERRVPAARRRGTGRSGVKWSLLVQVTVVPGPTAIAAGSNLYEGGRLTADVATGDASSGPGGAAAEQPEGHRGGCDRGAMRCRWVTISPGRDRRPRQDRPADRDEHERERAEVEDFADRVGEQERRPVRGGRSCS